MAPLGTGPNLFFFAFFFLDVFSSSEGFLPAPPPATSSEILAGGEAATASVELELEELELSFPPSAISDEDYSPL